MPTSRRSAIGANYYYNQIIDGNPNVMGLLAAEEDNLLAARRLALAHGWLRMVGCTMQGLQALYNRTGRRAEWRALVEEIVPLFVDKLTELARPGVAEEDWSIVTEYRVRLAEDARRWPEAERLQRVSIEVDRRRAAEALALPPEALDDDGRNLIRTLAVSLHELGQIQRERGEATCVTSYEETADLPSASATALPKLRCLQPRPRL